MVQFAFNLSRQHIHFCNSVNLISKKFDANRILRFICRNDLKHIPVYTEAATLEIHLISLILDINQSPNYIIAINLHTRSERHHHVHIVIRATDSIDTGYGRHYNHISALSQCSCCRQAQLINFIIDGRIFRNISIRLRHIRFRLIIVII